MRTGDNLQLYTFDGEDDAEGRPFDAVLMLIDQEDNIYNIKEFGKPVKHVTALWLAASMVYRKEYESRFAVV